MSRLRLHPENHFVDRIGWLRAAVLGANDGIMSTASLIVGVAAAAATQNEVLIAGIAGLVAGAMSMAAGEYVSVSSQSDTEQADLARERKELTENVAFEREELGRHLCEARRRQDLARQVADQLMAKDALTAHARDELGFRKSPPRVRSRQRLHRRRRFRSARPCLCSWSSYRPPAALVSIVSGHPWPFLHCWAQSGPRPVARTFCAPPPE